MTRRFITPEKLVSARFEDKALIPRWDAAIICFRDRKGSQALVDAFSGKPCGRKIFWGMEENAELPHVYTADVDGERIGIVARCLWGGPQAAILVEELAAMGVKVVIGYGAAGSLDAKLKHGEQLVVCCALGTDGASRYYGEGPFKPDQDMLALVSSATRVTAATVDVVYRETQGAIGVNLYLFTPFRIFCILNKETQRDKALSTNPADSLPAAVGQDAKKNPIDFINLLLNIKTAFLFGGFVLIRLERR